MLLCLFLVLLHSVVAQDPLKKYTISAPGINASFIPYGATITNLFVNDKNGDPQDVVLGYDNTSTYPNGPHTYYGSIVG
jgi:aldose 1-epimerase